MFVFRLVLIILCLRSYTLQKCDYDVDKFMEITCFDFTSTEEIKDKINSTLVRYASVARVIETLELKNCELWELRINSLRFLPELKHIKVSDSKIRLLSSGKNDDLFEEFIREPTGKTKGMYLK